jgi:hypothetical protein
VVVDVADATGETLIWNVVCFTLSMEAQNKRKSLNKKSLL